MPPKSKPKNKAKKSTKPSSCKKIALQDCPICHKPQLLNYDRHMNTIHDSGPKRRGLESLVEAGIRDYSPELIDENTEQTLLDNETYQLSELPPVSGISTVPSSMSKPPIMRTYNKLKKNRINKELLENILQQGSVERYNDDNDIVLFEYNDDDEEQYGGKRKKKRKSVKKRRKNKKSKSKKNRKTHKR